MVSEISEKNDAVIKLQQAFKLKEEHLMEQTKGKEAALEKRRMELVELKEALRQEQWLTEECKAHS